MTLFISSNVSFEAFVIRRLFDVGIEQKVELVDDLLLLVTLDLDAVEAGGQLSRLLDRPDPFPTFKAKRLITFLQLLLHIL